MNQAPILNLIANMTVTEGATADQIITASDPEGDALTFSIETGPAFVTILTPSPVGADSADVHVAPGAGDALGSPYTVHAKVSDGTADDTRIFSVAVIAAGGNPPVLTQPANMTVDEGATVDQTLTASDPDGDALSFTKEGGPTFMTVGTSTPTTGTVHLAPDFVDAGTYGATVRASDGTLNDQKSFTITVNNVNRAPTADAGGPYTGIVGIAVSFDGTASSDPDGNPLTYEWDFDVSNGITVDASGPTPSHTYGAANTYTATATISESGGFLANAFLDGGDRIIRLNQGRPFWCVELQPVGRSFRVTDIIPSTILASFGGVSIHAIGGKSIFVEDGAARFKVCFAKDQLRLLFASLPIGRRTANVTITGDLNGGGSFHASVDVVVQKAGPGSLAEGDGHGPGGDVHASPNPLNPSTVISFELSKPGSVKLNVYDVSGRHVKTLADGFMGSGVQYVGWDGTSRTGSRVASGVYFYVLQTPERTVKSQLVVAK